MTLVVLLGAVSAVAAETLYVAERMRIGLREEPTDVSAVVKTVETGLPLEVIGRQENFVQVREPQGMEGWIEARYLTPDPPVRLQFSKLQEDLTKARAETVEAQAQLKKTQAALAEQIAKIREWDKNAPNSPAQPVTPVAAQSPPVKSSEARGGFGFSFLWLGISFAMLGIGFAAGVRWLRESIRKRSGGMYLRV